MMKKYTLKKGFWEEEEVEDLLLIDEIVCDDYDAVYGYLYQPQPFTASIKDVVKKGGTYRLSDHVYQEIGDMLEDIGYECTGSREGRRGYYKTYIEVHGGTVTYHEPHEGVEQIYTFKKEK